MTSSESRTQTMKKEQSEFVIKDFPRMWYYPKWRLMSWHPLGVFNSAMADQIVEFTEKEERIQEAPFDRYTDFSGLTLVEFDVDHIFKIARHRRSVAQPVNSAFFANTPITLGIARMYEMLMREAIMIEVRVFEQRQSAAEWLGVPEKVLRPPAEGEGTRGRGHQGKS